jgi:RHS repeat-associated protein
MENSNKYSAGNPAVAGQQFEFAFDTIGNRVTARTGGDLYAANLRQADYGANFLNQYTNRSIPGFVDVQGSAHSNATVSVWGDNGSWSPTVRKGEYFRGELAVTNSSASVWLGFTNIAVLNTATNDIITNIVGHTFVPQTPEAFTHDLDGNLTGDGKWTYTWDGENRLVAMTNTTALPVTARKALTFTYDSRSRRIQKDVYLWNPSTLNYELSTQTKFVYDGWNLIAALNSQLSTLNTLLWGLDLSGSLQGAGGVGGLLFRSEISNGQISSSHAAAYDGNGNLTSLLNASTRTESARSEFGPFGEVLRATGPMATANPFRFSTKYQDDETGLLYYGFRYYDPATGRWISGDPIEEQGGLNLYGFVINSPGQFTDNLGQTIVNCLGHACGGGAGEVQPLWRSLEETLKDLGWTCKKAKSCKCNCKTEEAALVFVDIAKPDQWTANTTQKEIDTYLDSVRKQFKGVDVWSKRYFWDLPNPLDVHAIRRNCKVKLGEDGAWDYVEGRQGTRSDGRYDLVGPFRIGGVLSDPWAYWHQKKQVLFSMCCKRAKKSHILD